MKTNCRTPGVPGGIKQPFRTLIVNDPELLVMCLSDILGKLTLVQVVGTASNGSEALLRAEALAPDLVLMDLNMPCMGGLETTVQLRRRLPGTRIIIMTLDETAKARAAARAHGAHGFVGKSRLNGDLMAEIRRVFGLDGADDERGPG